MSDDLWIVVPNWPRFQHYTDRDPPWIKLYTELNSSAEWLQLSVAERGLLCTCWIEYARSRGVLPRHLVVSLCRGTAREKHWTSLSDAGLIQLSASKPLALARSRDVKKEILREDARGPAQQNGAAHALEEEELPRDPEALEKIKQLSRRIGNFPTQEAP